LGLEDFVEVVVTSEMVSKGKPDPEIYLETSKKLKENPSNCVVYEDALSGLRAAQSAGMKVVLVSTSHNVDEIEGIQVNGVIDNFLNVKNYGFFTKIQS
jgi:beta-phosphoglucomutase